MQRWRRTTRKACPPASPSVGVSSGADLDQRPVVVPSPFIACPVRTHIKDFAGTCAASRVAVKRPAEVVTVWSAPTARACRSRASGRSLAAPDCRRPRRGEPAGTHAEFAGPVQHDSGELGLGGEKDLIGHVPQQAAVLVPCPGGGQVSRVDQRVSVRRGVGEMHGDLAQPDSAQRAGVMVSGFARQLRLRSGQIDAQTVGRMRSSSAARATACPSAIDGETAGSRGDSTRSRAPAVASVSALAGMRRGTTS